MNKVTIIIWVFSLLYTNIVMAGVKNFEHHVDQLGFMSNVTSPGAVIDQRSGYYTGGGLMIRGNVDNLQFGHIDMPSINAGCGGINLYGGGFSFIGLPRIKEFGQNIVQNSVGYAAEIAIDTISPMISTSLNRMRSIANAINSQNINSCNMSAALVGGMFPKNEAARRIGCQAKAQGGVADFFAGRLDCATRGEEEIDKTAKGGKDIQSLLGTEYNLVYKALTDTGVVLQDAKKEEWWGDPKKGFDIDFKELLMSVSGTLIAEIAESNIKKKGAGGGGGGGGGGAIAAPPKSQKFRFMPSLFKSSEALSELLAGNIEGSKATMYKCQDTDKCLKLSQVNMNLKKGNSLISKVEKFLDDIAGKIQKDAGDVRLTPDEEKFIQFSHVPILKLLTMDVALKGQNTGGVKADYAESIAYDILINYLEEMLEIVHRSINELSHSQVDGDNIDRFKNEIRDVRAELKSKRGLALKRLNQVILAKQNAMLIEKKLRYHAAEILTAHER